MAGLVPVIHDLPCRNKGMDGRDKHTSGMPLAQIGCP
jgi:hypothetical protein